MGKRRKAENDFYRASSYVTAVLAVVILSVRPSVCMSVGHTHAL